MKTPTWRQCLLAFTALGFAGFALVILSGFWHVLAIIAVLGGIAWLWRFAKPGRK